MALRAGTLQRLFRDMHAGIQHVTSSPPVFQAIGRDLAGLARAPQWKFLDLVGTRRDSACSSVLIAGDPPVPGRRRSFPLNRVRLTEILVDNNEASAWT